MPELKSSDVQAMRIRTHAVRIDNRELMSISGVKDVESFNEQEIRLLTEAGILHIEGSELHITKLNLDDGQVIVEGEIIAMEYDEPVQERGGVFSRMFR